MRNADKNEKCMRSGQENDQTRIQVEEPAIEFMRALTDLPDDMILESAWKEDEGSVGKGRRCWLPILISAAAALVVGFISWGVFSGRPRVEKEDTTEVEMVTDAVISTERSSEEVDIGNSSEDIGKDNEIKEHTSPGSNTAVPSNGGSDDTQRTESTEPEMTENTESTETGKTISKVDEPEKSDNSREESKKEENKKKEAEKRDKDETEKDETTKDETTKDEIEKDETGIKNEKTAIDKFEAESLILAYVDPNHSLMSDQMTGYMDLPDSFGGTVSDCGDGLLHVYATTEETTEEYKEILKECPIVVYHSVDHSYYELKEVEAMIREHQGDFGFLKTSVDIALNKVVVEVEAGDYERMQEMVQGQPVLVRISGTVEQSMQEVLEMPEMNDVLEMPEMNDVLEMPELNEVLDHNE